MRRSVTPPGVQAQHDWFDFDGVIAGEHRVPHGLIGTLSHSRATFVWASQTMTQLAWQNGHLALLAVWRRAPLSARAGGA